MPKQLIKYEDVQEIISGLIKKKIELKDHALQIYRERYLKKKINGKIESVEERLASVAVDIASAEFQYIKGTYTEKLMQIKDFAGKIYDQMILKKFLFNTPTLMNFGRFEKIDNEIKPLSQMGSACFVLPIEDTFGDENIGDGILDQVKYQGLIHKSGGGTGFSFARLRPSGSIIGHNVKKGKGSIDWNKTTGITSGPLSFLKYLYDQETNAIKQGNSRRGANMGVQRIDHPDFLDHLYAKFGTDKNSKESQIINFNLSFAITDNFMQLAKDNKFYKLYNPHTKKYLTIKDICTQERFEEIMKSNKINPYNPLTIPSMYVKSDSSDIINSYTGETIGFDDGEHIKIRARRILQEIAKIAASNGEPGIIFIDRMNEYNPTPNLGEIEATNPCGEQPLMPYEACNLGSINLSKFIVYEDKDGIETAKIDYDSMSESIKILVQALDDVIDRSDFPLKKITDAVNLTRKIGLGVMGFADLLIKLKIPYNSDKAVHIAEEIANFLYETGKEKSEELAEQKGVFPVFKDSIYDKESKNFLKNKIMKYNRKMRNAAVTTIAPTGTISRLAETSSGIEPTFSLVFKSKIMNKIQHNISFGFLELSEHENIYNDRMLQAVSNNGGTVIINKETPEEIKKEIEIIPLKIRKILQTSTDGSITPDAHINIQSAFQKYNDSSISKTIILPAGSGPNDVLKCYYTAWENDLKGITIYIDKSRDIQVLNTTQIQKNKEKDYENYRRPLVQEAFTIELPIGDPLKKIGEYEEKSAVVFTTICFDSHKGRVNSIFQNMSFGSSHELIYLIAQNRAWSRLLKMSNGKVELLEKELRGLPQAHHEGALNENGSLKTRITNDTIPNAALKTIWFLKYITNGFKDWSKKTMEKHYNSYRRGDVFLKDIIKFEGQIKVGYEKGLPSIFPKDQIMIFDNNILTPKICPYCKRENPPFHLEERCVMYDCCGQSKCS